MKKISEPIVFFGSGPVAAESLRLLAADFVIEAVITKPRAPHHKGEVPVLALAEKLSLPVSTASSKDELNLLFRTEPFKSRLAILIDFGIIVSQEVIDYFPLGIINSHFSILPEWRGADPITFAILSGQKQTGVSLMFLVEAMDEGPLLAYGEYNVPQDATTPSLTDHLIKLSHGLLQHEVPRHLECTNTVPGPWGVPQDTTKRLVSYSRKLAKEDGNLDWRKPAELLEREVRAFIEWPKSRASFGTLDVIVTKAHVADAKGDVGTATVTDKKPAVHCATGTLVIDSLKPAGKKEMTGESFLAGYKQQFLH